MWTASRREEDGSRYKRAFKHPKKTCPRGVQGAKEDHERALMQAGGLEEEEESAERERES